MKWALEGGTVDERNPLPPQYRDVVLCRMFGWTPTQLDEAPAQFCDWAMAIARVEATTTHGR